MNENKPLIELISLAGKTAVITGAAAGMGEATARRFAESGANLYLLDIDEAGVTAVAHSLAHFPVRITPHTLDLSQKSEIDTFWDSLTEGEEPDIIVNNAGIFPFRDFLETDEALLQKVTDINFTAVYWMCQHFIRQRKESKQSGVIVNVSSIEAHLPFKEDLAHYTTGKAAVIALTRALARDYGRIGIRANVILPGGVITQGTKSAAKQAWKSPGLIKDGLNFKARLPLGRMGQPDEVARVTLILASDLTSYMTGAAIPVDGGFLSA
ncbi:MAG TPA: SDR family oxidoreductase [Anaerolineae bacterium]|nr:SDR family oxidoreductase [Anaerolineae bacterium]